MYHTKPFFAKILYEHIMFPLHLIYLQSTCQRSRSGEGTVAGPCCIQGSTHALYRRHHLAKDRQRQNEAQQCRVIHYLFLTRSVILSMSCGPFKFELIGSIGVDMNISLFAYLVVYDC